MGVHGHALRQLLVTAPDRQLARNFEFFKTRNRILHDKLLARVEVTPRERHRPLKYGRLQGPAAKDLVTSISPPIRSLERRAEAPTAARSVHAEATPDLRRRSGTWCCASGRVLCTVPVAC
ncbi:MAG: hypothetical protein ACJ8F7_22645 [Gemmataceae bacterium]